MHLPSDVVSLPLHQLDNQPETPGPMSVLEWRRAVWFQVQSIQHTANHQTSSHIKKSDLPCRRNRNWMYNSHSTSSDSGDELLDGPGVSRHHTTGRKPTTLPLIDLSQPTDADGRPIQFEDGRAKLVAQSHQPKKQMMTAPPDIEQRHREAIRRLQAEATEQLIYAEWEANHQRCTPQLDNSAKLHRFPSKRAPLQKLSDFARRSVSNFSVSNKTTAVESPPRTFTSAAHLDQSSQIINSKSSSPPTSNLKTGANFFRMIKRFGSVNQSSSKNKKIFSLNSEASISRKSLLSSFQLSASNTAFHS